MVRTSDEATDSTCWMGEGGVGGERVVDSLSEPAARMVPAMADATVPAVTRKPRSRLVRGIYFTLGLICLGGAYISFLPGIPTFDLVMLAAFFFARSSDKFHDWLVNHKVFGRIIAAYRGGGLTMRTKVVAAVGIVASLTFSAAVLMDSRILRTLLALVGIYALWFVFSRPTRRPDAEASPLPETLQPPETA